MMFSLCERTTNWRFVHLILCTAVSSDKQTQAQTCTIIQMSIFQRLVISTTRWFLESELNHIIYHRCPMENRYLHFWRFTVYGISTNLPSNRCVGYLQHSFITGPKYVAQHGWSSHKSPRTNRDNEPKSFFFFKMSDFHFFAECASWDSNEATPCFR